MFFAVLIGIIIMGAVSYQALDKKSTFLLRIVSLAALALMILTVIICLVLVFTDNRVPVDESFPIVGPPPETAPKEEGGNNLLVLFFSILFLIALFFIVFVLTMRENKKSQKSSSGLVKGKIP
ncbi:MAG: hypothetical protein FWB95_09715 [Treponema sp.]|nr:hypothetical protein [Treponema sp.]